MIASDLRINLHKMVEASGWRFFVKSLFFVEVVRFQMLYQNDVLKDVYGWCTEGRTGGYTWCIGMSLLLIYLIDIQSPSAIWDGTKKQLSKNLLFYFAFGSWLVACVRFINSNRHCLGLPYYFALFINSMNFNYFLTTTQKNTANFKLFCWSRYRNQLFRRWNGKTNFWLIDS